MEVVGEAGKEKQKKKKKETHVAGNCSFSLLQTHIHFRRVCFHFYTSRNTGLLSVSGIL